jgi:hypothetical protein
VASGDKDLQETCCSSRLFLDDLLYVIRNILNIVDERPGGFIGDEAAGTKRRFDGLLERIDLFALSGAHGTPLSWDKPIVIFLIEVIAQ